jgi:hypothetical protein
LIAAAMELKNQGFPTPRLEKRTVGLAMHGVVLLARTLMLYLSAIKVRLDIRHCYRESTSGE